MSSGLSTFSYKMLLLSIAFSVLTSSVHGSDFAEDLAACAAENLLNVCLRQVREKRGNLTDVLYGGWFGHWNMYYS